MELELQGAHIKHNFYVFDLGGEDLVLGVEWLESLEDVKVNWKQLTMKYKDGHTAVCLKGDSALTKTIVSLKSMLNSIKKREQGFLVEFGALSLQTQSDEEVIKEVNTLLEEYAGVCEEPKELPLTGRVTMP